MYLCACPTVEGFIHRIAVTYVSRGYVFYVVGHIPPGKDPAKVDAKLIERYGVDISKWSRARRKRAGAANVHYVRHGQVFVLLATHGEHDFFRAEATEVRDLRRVPLVVFGYSVSVRRGRAQVRVAREEMRRIRAHFLSVAVHRRREMIAGELSRLPFEPYSPVRRQLIALLLAVNRVRRRAGFAPVQVDAVRSHRKQVRPFGSCAGVAESD